MEIEITRHVDTVDKEAVGGHDVVYAYDRYRFSDNTVAIIARSYKAQPQEAHFLGIEAEGDFRMLQADDLRSSLFEQAVSYLRSIGKVEISWLSERAEGYEPVHPN